ncbi:MAG: T9SS type A sorting domain-containing protein [Bacteroidales bacterium]
MKKIFTLFLFITLCTMSFQLYAATDSVSCTFFIYPKAPVGCYTYVTYQGNAPGTATFNWNFDGGIIMSGSGPGPYYIVWDTLGNKTVTLYVDYNGQTCSSSNTIHIVADPQVFNVTGGGSYPYGGQGVHIGLSGSQTAISYYLYLNGGSSSVSSKEGTGSALDFGLFTAAGTYTCKAKYDTTSGACLTSMQDSAVITIAGSPPATPAICMVTYDTTTSKNMIIWNKPTNVYNLDHYNIYKQTYQANVYAKIAEVPFSSMSIYTDSTSNPLIHWDRYELSVTDTNGLESTLSSDHMTIHLDASSGFTGFNLTWNSYIGFTFQTYRIHRKHETGPWILIDSVAADSYTLLYTDPYFESGVTNYYIEVVKPYPCYPTLKENGYESVVSNVAVSAPLGIGENKQSGMMIYPNPAHDKLFIINQATGNFTAGIYSVDGRELISYSLNGTKAMLDVSNLIYGLYIIKIQSDQGILVNKFLKE